MPPGQTRGFAPAREGGPGLFAVHHFREGILVYINSCPHLGVPLDWVEGRFLNLDGTRIMCATHGAEFRINDGMCVRGPCRGDALTKVPCTIENGIVMVPPEAEDAIIPK